MFVHKSLLQGLTSLKLVVLYPIKIKGDMYHDEVINIHMDKPYFLICCEGRNAHKQKTENMETTHPSSSEIDCQKKYVSFSGGLL